MTESGALARCPPEYPTLKGRPMEITSFGTMRPHALSTGLTLTQVEAGKVCAKLGAQRRLKSTLRDLTVARLPGSPWKGSSGVYMVGNVEECLPHSVYLKSLTEAICVVTTLPHGDILRPLQTINSTDSDIMGPN